MKKFVDYIVLGGVAFLTLGISGIVVGTSYAEYQKYYEENYPQVDPADYADLLGIRAELKEGVVYYKNNKAKPKMDDFVVTGSYHPKKEGLEDFEQVLDPAKRPYTIVTSDMFSRDGGDITIKHKTFSYTIPNYQLVDIKVERLEIVENPFTVVYQSGRPFSTDGMKIKAVYNDGSETILKTSDYSVDKGTTALVTGDNKVVVSFNGKTIDVPISVQTTVNNGDVIRVITYDEYAVVGSGDTIANAEVALLGVFANGNKTPLLLSNFNIEDKYETVSFGKQYRFRANYKQNTSLKVDLPILVRNHIEGENGSIVNGKVKTEDEYVMNLDGSISRSGSVTFAGDFAASVMSGKPASVTYNVTAYSNTKTDIVLKCANSFLIQVGSSFYMKPLLINTIVDLYVNDEQVEIGDVVLSGCGPSGTYQYLYNIYSYITIKDVDLKLGANTVKFAFKMSTLGENTKWNESPSTFNIDWVNFNSYGSENESFSPVVRIYYPEDHGIVYGSYFDSLIVLAEHEDGTITALGNEDIITNKPTSGRFGIGSYSFTATLKSDESKTASININIAAIKLEAESATKSGNNKVVNTTETEYRYNSSSHTGTAIGKVTAVKGMDNSTKEYSGETSLTFTFQGYAGSQHLIVRCNNSYFFENGDSKYTNACQLSDCINVYVNGKSIGFNYTLPAISVTGNPDVCWMSFYEVDLGVISVIDGQNTIKIVGKSSAPVNTYNEPSIPRFDWIKIA